MKKLFLFLILVLIVSIVFGLSCFAEENTEINNDIENIENYDESNLSEDNSSVTVLDLYNVFYVIAFILVVMFLYLFISHVLRIK